MSVSFERLNGCADHQMWQDVRLAVDHEHASEFVSTILDAPGAPQPSDPQCQPRARRKASEMERSHDARLASLFSKTEIMVLRFYHAVHGHGSKD